MTRLVVVGGINQDVVVRADHRPAGGETVVGTGPSWSSGGKGANMAVAAARAGGEVALCAAVGDDAPGRALVAELADEGVDVGGVRVRSDSPTGVALIVLTPDGENSIAVGAGANHTLGLADLTRAAGEGAGVLLVQAEVGPATTDLAASYALAEPGTRLLLSLAPVCAVASATLQAADPLVLNETEGADTVRLCRGHVYADPLDLAAELRRVTGCASVVLTLGGDGAVVLDADTSSLVAAPRVEVVDTTGAGDVLTGVLAARLAAGLSLVDATRQACVAAAESVQHPGARGTSPG